MTVAERIEAVVRTINGGVFASVDYTTPNHGLLKTSKIDGSINPLWDRKADIVKVVDNCQINLGAVFGSVVDGRLVKKDIEPDYEVEACKGRIEHPQPHKNLCVSTKTNKTQIRYMPMGNQNMTVRYELDGNDISEQIALYKKPKYVSKKQTDAGLNEDEQVVWRTMEIDNIRAIRILGSEIS